MRRPSKIVMWAACTIVAIAVLIVAAILVGSRTQRGRTLIETLTFRLTAGTVKLSGLGGSPLSDLTLARLELIDRRGVWLSADQIALRWSPLALIEGRIQVDELHAAAVDMERTPESSTSSASPGPPNIPHIDVTQFSLPEVKLGADLAGRDVVLSGQGGGRLRALDDAHADLTARRIDGDGEYILHLHLDPKRMDAVLKVSEPASGPLENLLQLPGLGALSATVTVGGPRNAEIVAASIAAGELRAQAEGTVDLRAMAGDFRYSLTAPALSPRPGLAWQRLALEGNWHGKLSAPNADGQLDIAALHVPGGSAAAKLTAKLRAANGELAVTALLNGLEIPGLEPQILAKDPLEVSATMRLDQPTRPVLLTAAHRLFSLHADVATAAPQSATFELRIADLAPFAALASQDVHGEGTLKGKLRLDSGDLKSTLTSDLSLSGGSAGWIPLLGNRVALDFSGAMSDSRFNVDRLRVAGHPLTVSLDGNATRPAPGRQTHTLADFVDKVQARWEMEVDELGSIAPALDGNLHASGQVNGTADSLSSDAQLSSTLSVHGSPKGTITAELHARGLPSAPKGALKAHGDLDGFPLELDVQLERGAHNGVRAVIDRADWKSAHLDGDIDVERVVGNSRGQLHWHIEHIEDLDRVAGTTLAGSLEGHASIAPAGGKSQGEFDMDGKNLKFGQFAGDLHLSGVGATSALALKLTAESPGVFGVPADLAAKANFDLDDMQLRLDAVTAHYRGEEINLLSTATLSFAHGLAVDSLKLGADEAVLQIAGELSPALGIHASLHNAKPRLVNVFVPNLLADGAIEARLDLKGSLSAPIGKVSVTATGMRSADEDATGLPAADLYVNADLDGKIAALDAHLDANKAPVLTVKGGVPLQTDGAINVKVLGKLDIGLANALLEARGLHAAGALAVDASIVGNAADPDIKGSITLTDGTFRDYVRGVNLTHIAAEVTGSEGKLEIKSFNASAASGSLAMSGTIGVLQAGIPVDLKLTASKAQPITSNVFSANLDADIHVAGTAREHLDVAGQIRVNRALIGIPDSLPPDVAVLDVRRRGKQAPPPSSKLVVALDITIRAPEQILVQGRGLDAELGGEGVRITGTTDSPIVSGHFDLRRGSFSIGGNKLTLDNASSVSFDGAGLKKSIDPTLDFTANTTIRGTSIQVKVTGHADSPRFDIGNPSDSNMPQDEILSLLLFGESAAALTPIQLAQVGAALATLGGVGGGGPNPLVKLQKTLGLDRLSVSGNTTPTPTGGTENNGAAISAGRYVSKRVYIEGRQTTTGASQVQVEVDLAKGLKLQTKLGNGGTAVTQGTTPDTDPGSSIGLLYQFEY